MSGAPVALPIDWDEPSDGFDPQRWAAPAAAGRIASSPDPWADLPHEHQRLGLAVIISPASGVNPAAHP